MNKFKNKKRLIGLVVVFAMIFAVGTAFALTTQTLDIQGTITIAADPPEADVYWSDVVPAPQFVPLFVYNYGTVENVVAVDADDDTLITWGMTFIGDAEYGLLATIVATARNRGTEPVIITEVEVEFDADLADFDFEYEINQVILGVDFVSDIPLLPGETRDVAVGIGWFGEMPAGFDLELEEYEEITVGGVTITFEAEPYIS